MICFGCDWYLERGMPGKVEYICTLDCRNIMGVVSCNRVEKDRVVVDLGYGAVPEKVEEPVLGNQSTPPLSKKRGRPRKQAKTL